LSPKETQNAKAAMSLQETQNSKADMEDAILGVWSEGRDEARGSDMHDVDEESSLHMNIVLVVAECLDVYMREKQAEQGACTCTYIHACMYTYMCCFGGRLVP
jgi:hypothetical protein